MKSGLLLCLFFGLAVAALRGTSTTVARADFVFNNGGEISTLDPAATSGAPEGRVMYALYEGLTVKHPESLEPLPGVAEAWTQSEDGRTYTFHLRKDAQWSNGDPVTAHDFEWSWKRLLSPETGAEYAYQLWYLENAEKYTRLEDEREREKLWPQVGARAIDRFTFEVRLTAPTPFFLHLTSFYATLPVHRKSIERAQRTHPETWQVEWLQPRNLVTNGPFTLLERRLHDRIRLRKNPLYWDAARVAFNTIDILAVESQSAMLNLYLTGEVDWIERCAPNLVPRMLAREDFSPVPYLASYFYRVNVHKPPFDDKRVRRALALTIDRRAIAAKITKKGERPSWSLCPPGLAGYERAEMEHAAVSADLSNYDEAYAEDCAQAVALLSEAGYGVGKQELPTVEIHYNNSESHRDIALVIADRWRRVLGVDAQLRNQEWKVYLDTQRNIGYDVSRSIWIQDYPDPNTFIDLFVGDGENNRTGWSHPRYDELVRAAALEADERRRMELLREAEAILVDELPILPVYSYTTSNVVNPRLGGFFENRQDDHFPKFWYWMDDEELAARRSTRSGSKRIVPAPGPRHGQYPPAGREAVYR